MELEVSMLHIKRISFGWFIGLIMAVLLAGTSPALLAELQPAVSAPPKHVTLTWTGDPKTTQTITWKTTAASSTGQVQYGEATAAGVFPGKAVKVEALAEPFPAETGNMTVYSVTLTGLKPGTRYLYRVGDGVEWSEPSSFITEANSISGFKFLVFGDSQSGCYDVWHAVIHQAFEATLMRRFCLSWGIWWRLDRIMPNGTPGLMLLRELSALFLLCR
jgi:acid phosphatase type 7